MGPTSRRFRDTSPARALLMLDCESCFIARCMYGGGDGGGGGFSTKSLPLKMPVSGQSYVTLQRLI